LPFKYYYRDGEKEMVKNNRHGGMAKAVLAAFIAAVFLKTCVFDFMLVDGDSMEPALVSGQIVLINRLAYGIRAPVFKRDSGEYLVRWKYPRENDVVVFWTPSNELAVKRISSIITGRITERRFTASGDNAPQSYDSRAYGPVPIDNIIGKVLLTK
jgi:signal peptidase I